MLAEKKLQAGVIYGDQVNGEYVYMPGSEVGAAEPLYIYESEGSRQDVDITEALRLITVRSLRPTRHPSLGESSC